jgi:uncharacterized membrane protein
MQTSTHPWVGSLYLSAHLKEAGSLAVIPMKTLRVETLADGIFAIVMTLMAFDLKAPPATTAPDRLVEALMAMAPKFGLYAVSFVILGVYWIAHHNLLHFIRRSDRTFLWLNISFLMVVAILPFSTTLLGEFGGQKPAVILYGANLIAIGLTLFVLWAYSVRHNLLIEGEFSPRMVDIVNRKLLLTPLLCTLAITLAFADTRLSLALYILAPLLHIVPWSIDRHWKE